MVDASAFAVELPAMIVAANAFTIDNSSRQLRAAMGASIADEVNLPARATIEREVFAQNSNGDAPFRLQIARLINREPELAEEPASQCARAGMHIILDVDAGRIPGGIIHGVSPQ